MARQERNQDLRGLPGRVPSAPHSPALQESLGPVQRGLDRERLAMEPEGAAGQRRGRQIAVVGQFPAPVGLLDAHQPSQRALDRVRVGLRCVLAASAGLARWPAKIPSSPCNSFKMKLRWKFKDTLVHRTSPPPLEHTIK